MSDPDEQHPVLWARFPTGQQIPPQWQGIGEPGTKPTHGTDYRANRSRPWRRALLLATWFRLAVALVALPVVMALLRLLVL